MDLPTTEPPPTQEPHPLKAGEILKRLAALRDEQAAVRDEDKRLGREIEELEGAAMRFMRKHEIHKLPGDGITLSRVEKTKVVADDWLGYLRWAVENELPDAVQKRPGATAVIAASDAGVPLPDFIRLDSFEQIQTTRR